MINPDTADGLDLSGTWHGQYNYQGRKKDPVPFVAHLAEGDSWLTGVITEVGTVGTAKGIEIEATVDGRRAGRSIIFLKLYNGAHRDTIL